ncbi:MAG: thioesterase family protein [Planctomycetota bacterium]
MNLYFRLLWTILAARFRPAAHVLDEVATPFRVWPTDMDVNRHMNNARFLSLMDLARVDLMLRSGFGKLVRRERLYPVVASQTIRYRRSLGLFDRFAVHTRVLGWDERFIFLQQTFRSGGQPVASAVVKAIFLRAKGGGRVVPAELFGLAGLSGDERELPAWVDEWVRSEDQAWETVDA